MTLEKLMSYPPAQRRKYKLYNPRGRYRPRDRKPKTPDELIALLRRHNIRTRKELYALKVSGRVDPDVCPIPHDYIAEFDTWTAAVNVAFGPEILKVPETAEYLIRCCLEMTLWTQHHYRVARRKHPDILPPTTAPVRVFGSYENMFVAAARSSLKHTMDRYILLATGLGRRPTVQDCKDAGIELEIVRKTLGSKRELDKLLSQF